MIYTNQDRPEALARYLAKKERRGQVVGFVGDDDKTHATVRTQPLPPGLSVLSRCLKQSRGRSTPAIPFIANPKHPLCLACVAAIEDEIRGEKA